jgi:hypothetical protein
MSIYVQNNLVTRLPHDRTQISMALGRSLADLLSLPRINLVIGEFNSQSCKTCSHAVVPWQVFVFGFQSISQFNSIIIM